MLKWLFERISMYLANHADPGVVVADKPGGGAREEKQWLAETLQLTNDGTEYVRPGRIVSPSSPRTRNMCRICNWLIW